MQESRDATIKIFGTKIPFLVVESVPKNPGGNLTSPLTLTRLEKEKSDRDDDEEDEGTELEKDFSSEKIIDTGKFLNMESLVHGETLTRTDENLKTTSLDKESESSRTENEQSDGTNSQEKTLKKPDKILPCPRCNSMDTKFCYYNNYNIHQPRHFCRACQRYWTAGGSMRKMQVGAGRRRSKNSSSHYGLISEALQVAQIDAMGGFELNHPTWNTNCSVLSFGLNTPICDSMASVLKFSDNKVSNGTQERLCNSEEQRFPVPCIGGENGNDCSSESSITVSNPVGEGGQNYTEPPMRNMNGYPYLPGVPLSYPWNLAVPPLGYCPPGYHPMLFYPAAAYWNFGTPVGAMNNALLSPDSPSKSSYENTPSMSSNSPTLGKHLRDGDISKPDDSGKELPEQKKQRVLVPKTLRIDDPSEAAKSSIWATLGIKNESLSSGGLLSKAFESKTNDKINTARTSPMLCANPAALSRSISFLENS